MLLFQLLLDRTTSVFHRYLLMFGRAGIGKTQENNKTVIVAYIWLGLGPYGFVCGWSPLVGGCWPLALAGIWWVSYDYGTLVFFSFLGLFNLFHSF